MINYTPHVIIPGVGALGLGDLPRRIPPGGLSSDLESLPERMKRLDFSKPVTHRLTPGSNNYINPNTNSTRSSRRVTLTRGNLRGKSPGGESPDGWSSPSS